MNAESETQLFGFLSEWVSKSRGSIGDSHKRLKALLFTHRQGDPDALCSAAGLSLLIERMLPEQPEIKNRSSARSEHTRDKCVQQIRYPVRGSDL